MNESFSQATELHVRTHSFLLRDSSRSTDKQLEDPITDLIKGLEEALPIHALRYQLKIHYDEYIAEAILVSTATGVMHTLVENVLAFVTKSSNRLIERVATY